MTKDTQQVAIRDERYALTLCNAVEMLLGVIAERRHALTDGPTERGNDR